MKKLIKTILVCVIVVITVIAEVYSINNYDADCSYLNQVEKEYSVSHPMPKYKRIIWAILR